MLCSVSNVSICFNHTSLSARYIKSNVMAFYPKEPGGATMAFGMLDAEDETREEWPRPLKVVDVGRGVCCILNVVIHRDISAFS